MGKTFLEKRSWARLLLTFQRILTLHLVAFQVGASSREVNGCTSGVGYDRDGFCHSSTHTCLDISALSVFY